VIDFNHNEKKVINFNRNDF